MKKLKKNEMPDVTLKKKKKKGDSPGERRKKGKTSQYKFYELGLGVIRRLLKKR